FSRNQERIGYLQVAHRAPLDVGGRWHKRITNISALLAGPEEFDDVFSTIIRGHSQAVAVDANPIYFHHRKRLADVAVKARMRGYVGCQGVCTGRRPYGIWTEATFLTIAGPPPTSITSSKAPSLPTCLSSNPRGVGW